MTTARVGRAGGRCRVVRRSLLARWLLVGALIAGLWPTTAAAAETRCEGFGSTTIGGAGAEVYHVTTLDDIYAGPGSLRDALSAGPRLIVFDVAGDIDLTAPILVEGAFITVDGASAPSPGITLNRDGLIIRGTHGAHDVILRSLRIRDSADSGVEIGFGAWNVVLEQVSITGSASGNLDVLGSSDVSVCWSLLADPGNYNVAIGDGSARVSLHDNLLAFGVVGSPDVAIDDLGTPASDTTLDMRNNVVWQWWNGWGTAVHHGAQANVVDNLYVSPNSDPVDRANALIVCRGDCNGDPATAARAYVAGNLNGDGVTDVDAQGTESAPFPAPVLATRYVCDAAADVLAGAGMRPLDAVDEAYLAGGGYTSRLALPGNCIPDLVVEDVTAPLTAAPGATISVTETTRNAGGGRTPPSVTRFYFSPTATLGPDAVSIGTRPAPSLDPGAGDTATTEVTIPASAGALGTYYVIAAADAGDVVDESRETNNATAVKVRVGPDLIIDALDAPSTAPAGGTIVVTDRIRNRGLGPVGTSVTHFYLSTVSVIDDSAVDLGSRAVPALDPAVSDTGSTSLRIPAGAGAAGTYYLLARADDGNAINEVNETNNVIFRTIKIGPDLIVDTVAAPASAVAGTTIAVTDTTRNRGVSAAPASRVDFYLSALTTLDASAVRLGERALPALEAGAVSTATTSLVVPVTAGAAGSYYVLAVADPGGAIPEPNEANNVASSALIRIGPDLVVDSVVAPASALAGGTIDVTDTARNRGVSAAAPSRVDFYLSTLTTLDGGAVRLGGRALPALEAGAISTATTSLVVPLTAGAAGSYYVLAVADAGGAIAEPNETNNVTSSGLVRIGPDLVVDSVVAPASALAGATIAVTDSTRNRGVSAAAPTTLRFLLSTVAGVAPGAVELGSRAVPALEAGAIDSATTTLTLPADAGTAGTYYVVAVADATAAVVETSEANNATAARIRIGADLAVDTLSMRTTATPGAVISVGDTTRNRGLGPAAPSVTKFYLSPRTVLDSGAIYVGSRAIPALEAGVASTGTTPFTVPQIGGFYYLLAVADADGALVETVETNNVLASAGIVVGSDLVIDAVTPPLSAVAGTAIVVTDTTRNRGANPAPASSTSFYLSLRSTWDTGALYLGNRSVPALAPGVTDTAATTLTIPRTVGEAGTYYILAVADGDQRVPEYQEGNNVRAARIKIGPDLVLDTTTMPASAVAGVPLVVPTTVRNRGGAPAASTTLRFYLSTRKTYDDFLAVPVGARTVPALAAGAISSGNVTITIPAGTPASAYYLIAVVDADHVSQETNETNNGKYWPFAVQ